MQTPYRPPTARVADPGSSSSEPRPGAIKLALALIAVFVLVECYHQVASLPAVDRAEISALQWLIDWLWVVAIAVAGLMIAKGRNWARWVLLALTLRALYHFSDAMLFISMFEAGDSLLDEFATPFNRFMIYMGPLCAVGATILLFGPGRGWFGPRT
jgi:hypothetical protein